MLISYGILTIAVIAIIVWLFELDIKSGVYMVIMFTPATVFHFLVDAGWLRTAKKVAWAMYLVHVLFWEEDFVSFLELLKEAHEEEVES